MRPNKDETAVKGLSFARSLVIFFDTRVRTHAWTHTALPQGDIANIWQNMRMRALTMKKSKSMYRKTSKTRNVALTMNKKAIKNRWLLNPGQKKGTQAFKKRDFAKKNYILLIICRVNCRVLR